MEPSSETSQADWIVASLRDFGTNVGSVVPPRFECYVRVLHPARSAGDQVVRWRDLAEAAGLTVDHSTRFDVLLEAAAAGDQLVPPKAGTLDLTEVRALAEIVADHTGTPWFCWFGVWDGYGWMRGGHAAGTLRAGGRRRAGVTHRIRQRLRSLIGSRPGPTAWPRVELPHRPLVLFRGAVEEADAFYTATTYQSPNLWWPRDRSWCVASEVDLVSTYVGGSRALTQRVLHDDRLEAVQTTPDAPLAG